MTLSTISLLFKYAIPAAAKYIAKKVIKDQAKRIIAEKEAESKQLEIMLKLKKEVDDKCDQLEKNTMSVTTKSTYEETK